MEEKRSKIKDLLKGILSNGGYVIGLVFICTLIIVAVINLGTTIDIIGRFLAIIAPFIFGFFFAYLIRPIVVTLEKPLKKIKKGKGEKIKRVQYCRFLSDRNRCIDDYHCIYFPSDEKQCERYRQFCKKWIQLCNKSSG